MYSEKQIDKEILRLKAGKKYRIFSYTVLISIIILMRFLDKDSDIVLLTGFSIILWITVVLNEIQKKKIVARLSDKE